jgi:hypothetical protein
MLNNIVVVVELSSIPHILLSLAPDPCENYQLTRHIADQVRYLSDPDDFLPSRISDFADHE